MKQFYLLILVVSAPIYAQLPSYVPSNGLVSWWQFSGDAQDQSPNGNHLTVSNATLTTDRFDDSNAAYLFNGTSSYLTNSAISHTFSQTGSFSISIWLKKGTSNDDVAIMSGSATSNNFIWLIQTGSSVSMFGTNKQGASWFWINGPTFVLNDWEHFVGVYSNGVMKFYKNAILVGTTTNTHTSVSQASLPIWIGRAIGGGYFNGSIDDVGIWDRELTDTEIDQLFQGTLTTTSFSSQLANVYPNPSSTILNIDLPIEKIGTSFTIFDGLSRKVYADRVQDVNLKIDISNFEKGVYFLKMNEEPNTIKFLKE